MKRRGYALPLSLCVAGVTLMLGLSAASMTNGDLGLANHQYYQERARQAADFGLEYCVSHQVTPGTVVPVQSLSNVHPHDTVTIRVYHPDSADSPVKVPQGFEYWVAEGHASENAGGAPLASARVGAMVRYGLPVGTAGAQVHSLSVRSEQPVDFLVIDGLANQPVLNENVISSDYDGANIPLPFPSADQNFALDLGKVGNFMGNFRLPKNTDQSVIHQDPTSNAKITVAQDGGPSNTPVFSPPAGLTYISGLTVANNFNGILPSGHYGSLTLPPDAVVELKGTYHIEALNLSASTPAGQGGMLKVRDNTSAKVYVDKIQLGAGSLQLTNENPSAQNFRFTLQAIRATGGEPILNFKLVNGGGLALVADGHRLSLEADGSREIRGAFTAAALLAKYPPAPIGIVRNSVFIYDVSATTARRSQSDQGSVEGTDDLSTTSTGNAGNAGNTGNTNSSGDGSNTSQGDGSDNYDGTTGQDNTTGSNPRIARPAGVEPMILSRQAL